MLASKDPPDDTATVRDFVLGSFLLASRAPPDGAVTYCVPWVIYEASPGDGSWSYLHFSSGIADCPFGCLLFFSRLLVLRVRYFPDWLVTW